MIDTAMEGSLMQKDPEDTDTHTDKERESKRERHVHSFTQRRTLSHGGGPHIRTSTFVNISTCTNGKGGNTNVQLDVHISNE